MLIINENSKKKKYIYIYIYINTHKKGWILKIV